MDTPGRQSVDRDEWVALHQVAMHARDAVEIAAAAGVQLGPLRAALDRTNYKTPGWLERKMQPRADGEHVDVCRHCGDPVNEPPGTVNGSRILWHTETMQVHCADFQHQAERADS